MRCANPFARVAKRQRRKTMPKPLATTKQSASELQSLIELFQRLGHSSLEKAISAQLDCEFYKDLLKRVKADEPLEEFKGIPRSKVIKTLENLLAKHQKVMSVAWDLPPQAAPLLKTTVKSYKIKSESILCYDITYETGSGTYAAKIRITTRRRSLEVSMGGSNLSLSKLSSDLVLLMLR